MTSSTTDTSFSRNTRVSGSAPSSVQTVHQDWSNIQITFEDYQQRIHKKPRPSSKSDHKKRSKHRKAGSSLEAKELSINLHNKRERKANSFAAEPEAKNIQKNKKYIKNIKNNNALEVENEINPSYIRSKSQKSPNMRVNKKRSKEREKRHLRKKRKEKYKKPRKSLPEKKAIQHLNNKINRDDIYSSDPETNLKFLATANFRVQYAIEHSHRISSSFPHKTMNNNYDDEEIDPIPLHMQNNHSNKYNLLATQALNTKSALPPLTKIHHSHQDNDIDDEYHIPSKKTIISHSYSTPSKIYTHHQCHPPPSAFIPPPPIHSHPEIFSHHHSPQMKSSSAHVQGLSSALYAYQTSNDHSYEYSNHTNNHLQSITAIDHDGYGGGSSPPKTATSFTPMDNGSDDDDDDDDDNLFTPVHYNHRFSLTNASFANRNTVNIMRASAMTTTNMNVNRTSLHGQQTFTRMSTSHSTSQSYSGSIPNYSLSANSKRNPSHSHSHNHSGSNIVIQPLYQSQCNTIIPLQTSDFIPGPPPPPSEPVPKDLMKKYKNRKKRKYKSSNSKKIEQTVIVVESVENGEDMSGNQTPSVSQCSDHQSDDIDLTIVEAIQRDRNYRPSVASHIDHTDEKFSVNIDRYGFPTTDVMDEKEHRKLIRKENERLNKWQEMIYGNKKGQMSSLSQGIIQIEIDQWNLVKNHRKLKSRIRKGIPQQMRGTIWQNLCGARDRRKIETVRYGSKSLYSDLKNKKKSPYHQQLWKDINRTYRKHASFGLVDVARNNNKNENNGSAKKHKKQKFFKNDIQDSAILITPQDLEMNATEAQMSLYNVLKAFSLYRKDIGYCQGMQSVTALMLMHMTEEEAFWVLASLADDTKYQLENLWRPTMPAIQLRFYQMERMVKLTLPKLAAHFDYHQIISASMYQASQWFITIFLATNMKFPVLLRLWDIYLNEGLKTVYRMGVGLLKYWEKELLKCTFEEMCEFFRTGSSLLEVEEYIRICFSFKITHAHLAAFERDFNRQNKK